MRPLKIFVSHAHGDARDARWLARELEEGLARRGRRVEVFSTSEPEHRLPDPFAAAEAGADLRDIARVAAEQLRAYLAAAIADSSAYVLLVTPNSARTARPWIRFEFHEATALARERRIPYVPCLLGVDNDALWQMTNASPDASRWHETEAGNPAPMRPHEWQAIRVDDARERDRLIDLLAAIEPTQS